jgi:alginate O-acetyltransferase complex protein AlgI
LLFNSYGYLAGFLPISWLVYFGCCKWIPRLRLVALLVLSIIFYGYWDWRFVSLIVQSILINWLAARWFIAAGRASIIYGAIALNLIVLGFFKYFNFFTGLLPDSWNAPHLDIALPLGISFFTFHHVMYLTDLRRKQAPKLSLVQYGLYIAFFPQVLAGPLVRWREIMPQFNATLSTQYKWRSEALGLMLIVVGLCEKALLGDNLALLANVVFTNADSAPVAPIDAWLGTLSFTFQIFFDFSGYTDMAIGSAMLFGITLPQNFNAPYRAISLQDFWRRWHMTLSRFLRDYLYIPLGGNRHGLSIQLMALLTTMSLGGLWHGAGLTFLAWGAAHGVGLGAETVWRKLKLPMPALLFGPLTFLFVVFCWVLFRSQHFGTAARIYEALLFTRQSGADQQIGGVHAIAFIAVAAVLAIALPNTTQWIERLEPKPIHAIAFGLLAACGVLALNSTESFQFIYFQF